MTTNKSNKEEKRLMFFDMQEHPERYTDEQVEYILSRHGHDKDGAAKVKNQECER